MRAGISAGGDSCHLSLQHAGLFQVLWSQQQELARASQLVLSSRKISPVPALGVGIMFLLQGMAVFHCVCFSNFILLF